MKKTLIAIICLLIGSVNLYAQNEIDALRYSRLNQSGTARYMALGGAFTALGGDFTTLSHNPAGIAIYKNSEVTFTPSIFIGKTQATYFGETNEDYRYNFNLGNIGVVMVTSPALRNPSSPWKNIQFGFGLNRLANFNNRVVMDGFNETSSYLTPYIDAADGLEPGDLNNFGTGLAYDTELLYEIDTLNHHYYIDMPNGGVRQRKTIDSKGSINELVFSFGGNYNDRVYLGGTIGVPYIKYKETSIYSETDEMESNNYFKSFTRTDKLETSGTGLNLKLGMIVRAADWLRVGGAIETPTFYTDMSDTYSTTFRAVYETAGTKRSSADGFFEYELNTPFKASAGIGLIIGKVGIISADYEYLDYSTARLRSEEYDFDAENSAIKTSYVKAHNIRLGTEWRYGSLSFRGGYGISDNPYKYGTNSVMSSYSAGLGIRTGNFFVDMAWVMSNMDDEYYLYSAPAGTDPAIADATINNNMFLVTLGFKY